MASDLWIDSHFHPQLLIKAADGGDDTAALEASIAKIAQGLMVSVTLQDRPILEALSLKHSHLQWSLGLHPCYVENKEIVDLTQAMSETPSFAAIGETGLDRFHSQDAQHLAQQHLFFEHHMEWARQLQKPVIIHTRDAGKETRAVLSHYSGVRGVIHCFTESLEFARHVLDLGWMISFSGILTFPSAHDLRQIARYVPIESILIETDSPYLAPHPFRGKRNQPAYVQYVGEQLSQIKSLDIAACQEHMLNNYRRFLTLNHSDPLAR